MGKFMKSLAPASMAVATVVAGSTLYAADPRDPHMMENGMMGHGGMTGMMGHMSRMMDHCSAMMRDGDEHRPNGQWREHAPENGG
jgi:hypothetical protein